MIDNSYHACVFVADNLKLIRCYRYRVLAHLWWTWYELVGAYCAADHLMIIGTIHRSVCVNFGRCRVLTLLWGTCMVRVGRGGRGHIVSGSSQMSWSCMCPNMWNMQELSGTQNTGRKVHYKVPKFCDFFMFSTNSHN